MGTFQLEQWGTACLTMRTSLHILVLASCVVFISSSPASESHQSDEGSGDGPEIAINDVVEKTVDATNDDSTDASVNSPSDLLNMEMNPEENEIKVNEEIVDDEETKLALKKCKKCIRYHYRSRNGEFCGSCDKKTGDEDKKNEDKTTQGSEKNRCKKCARKNFKARNEVFCAEQCSTSDIENPIEKKHHKKDHNKKMHNQKKHGNNVKSENEEITETTNEPVEEDLEELESNEMKKNKKRKTQKQKNKEKKQHKNKNKKHEDKKEEEMVSDIEVPTEEDPEEQKDTIKLGPLENLIKFLIKSNTYTH